MKRWGVGAYLLFVQEQFQQSVPAALLVRSELLTAIELDNLNLSFPKNITVYLSNLEGLGLISVERNRAIATPEASESYARIEAFYPPPTKTPENVAKRELVRGFAQLTPFGSMFVRACCNG